MTEEYSRYALGDFYANSSATDHTWSAIPDSIAGVTRKLLCTRQKLYHAKCKQSAAHRFSHFLL